MRLPRYKDMNLGLQRPFWLKHEESLKKSRGRWSSGDIVYPLDPALHEALCLCISLFLLKQVDVEFLPLDRQALTNTIEPLKNAIIELDKTS